MSSSSSYQKLSVGGNSTKNQLAVIELRAVEKIYSTAAGDFPAIRGVDLQVQAGEFVGIIGKSGAGKSTLLNMVTGVDHLTAGEVRVQTNGSAVSVHQMSEDAIARRAYELYLARGRADGSAIDDWLQAENELRGRRLKG